MKSKPLAPSATIGIIAPGSSCHPKVYAAGIQEVKNRGYNIKAPLSPTMFYGRYDHGFSSASPEARSAVLSQLANDPEVSVIIAARGGYGTLELLPYINFNSLRKAQKPIVGCSDVTALLIAALGKADAPAIYGPVIARDFARVNEAQASKMNVDKLFSLLSNPNEKLEVKCNAVRSGKARGRIIAGRLSVLLSLVGTPYDISYDNAILFLEDRAEEPFRIHRSLTQLRLTGKLDSLGALVLGGFVQSETKGGPSADEVVEKCVEEILKTTTYPVLSGFALGYGGVSHPLPLGCEAEIDNDTFRLLESPIA